MIGVELACMFHGLGSQVTIVEMLPDMLAPVDAEVRTLLVRSLSRRGITIVTDATVQFIADEGSMKKVGARTPEGDQSFSGEYVLVSVSRRANTSGLEHLMEQRLAHDRGRVRVNEKMETSLPGIYAIGDLVRGAGLAHVASMEGEVAASNALGHETTMNYDVVPNPIYTSPEVAFVGLTEAQAKEKDPEVRIARFPWSANGKAVSSAHSDGFTKVILGKRNKLVGAHIIGPDATNLINGICGCHAE